MFFFFRNQKQVDENPLAFHIEENGRYKSIFFDIEGKKMCWYPLADSDPTLRKIIGMSDHALLHSNGMGAHNEGGSDNRMGGLNALTLINITHTGRVIKIINMVLLHRACSSQCCNK